MAGDKPNNETIIGLGQDEPGRMLAYRSHGADRDGTFQAMNEKDYAGLRGQGNFREIGDVARGIDRHLRQDHLVGMAITALDADNKVVADSAMAADFVDIGTIRGALPDNLRDNVMRVALEGVADPRYDAKSIAEASLHILKHQERQANDDLNNARIDATEYDDDEINRNIKDKRVDAREQELADAAKATRAGCAEAAAIDSSVKDLALMDKMADDLMTNPNPASTAKKQEVIEKISKMPDDTNGMPSPLPLPPAPATPTSTPGMSGP